MKDVIKKIYKYDKKLATRVAASLGYKIIAKAYADVIFLQNEDDFDGFSGSGGKGREGFFDSSEKEMLKFLMQWDYGDWKYGEIRKDKPWGSSDTVYKKKIGKNTYILSYNSRIGYAGLSVELNK